MTFLVPAGISKYNALEAKLTFQKNHVFKWLGLNGQISYAYSSFKNSGGGERHGPGRDFQQRSGFHRSCS